VSLAGLVSTDRNASGAGAHHDTRSVAERRGQGDIDVGGDYDGRRQVLRPQRLSQLLPLRLPARTGGAYHQHISIQPPCRCQCTPDHFGDGGGGYQRPPRTHGSARTVGTAQDLAFL
jgi:hypothetical protein